MSGVALASPEYRAGHGSAGGEFVSRGHLA
jgi:hypothetical protein